MAGMSVPILRSSAMAASLLSLGIAVDAFSAPADLAARGLDVFVHAPQQGAPGDTLPVQIQAYGFPTVNTVVGLAGAAVEATWDPESLGPEAGSVPPPVRATADGAGRVHLEVPVPPGPARELALLIGVRSGAHERTRAIKVNRIRAHEIRLHVAERAVVPGSTIPAWVLLRDSTTEKPVAGAVVEVSLLEGGVVRSRTTVKTDASGSAIGRVGIPPVEEPGWRWTLRAEEPGQGDRDTTADEVSLFPREETPGTPRLTASWDEGSVHAGARATFTVRVRDASDEPVGNHPVRYFIAPKGIKAPDDPKKWEQVSTLAVTDLAGEIKGAYDAPTTVAPVVGTYLQLVVRTRVQGQDLAQTSTVSVGRPSPSIALYPEGGTIVGGIEQRVLMRVVDDRGEPVRGRFGVKADGMDTEVATNAEGEVEFAWKTPGQVGAFRGVGPCANEVASTVVVRPLGELQAFGGRAEPYQLCVPVDRDAAGLLRVEPAVVRAGEKVHVQVLGAGHRPWSVVFGNGASAASTWIQDGETGGEVTVPQGARGFWSVTAVSPGDKASSKVLQGGVLVRPAVLPSIVAKVTGGRAAPNGAVEIEADLTDGKGGGLPGAVAALVYDLYGGGSVEGLWGLDTRRSLCAEAGVDVERCDGFLDGDASFDPVRRGLMGSHPRSGVVPVLDPGASVQQALDNAFRSIVHSLEGAVLESTDSPERLRDVRRKGPGGWTFNPELWTLVTAAMNEPPVTPGGEPFTLGDVMAIDRQVSFDNVARRVTRLKLFRVLAAVRSYIRDRQLGPDEPALRDPGAILRRIVRDGQLPESALVDPWGGSMQFVRGTTVGLPFLTLRGWELHAPGPDGAVGTADDVKDPFERVLESKTPYAEAVDEDRLVDARLDMEVGEATVSAWQSLFEELTGTSLGSIGTVGHGAGTGTGEGFGSGHGRLGGSHQVRAPRVQMGVTKDGTVWLPPVRTDAKGHVKLRIPLGGVETTWRVALVGMPDQAGTATTMIDVPVSLPLSSNIETGAFWIQGDEGDVRVSVRNRNALPVRASVVIAASGAAALSMPRDGRKTLDIPARGVAELRLRVKGVRPGKAILEARTAVAGLPDDVARQEWEIRPAGETTDVTQMAWVSGESRVALPLDPRATTPLGGAVLQIERGYEPLLHAALDALEPDRLRSPDAVSDSLETAMRIRGWAVARGGETEPLANRAREIARRALGRIATWSEIVRANAVWKETAARANVAELKTVLSGLPKPSECPPDGKPTAETAASWLELEPAPVGGVVAACWDAFVTGATETVMSAADPVLLARAVLALSERSHRAAVATAMAKRLEEQVNLQATGYLDLPGFMSSSRSARAIIYAALLRVAVRGVKLAAPPDRLASWLVVQRDAYGGYGSSTATRLAVQSLLAATPSGQGPARVSFEVSGKESTFDMPASGVRAVALPAGADAVTVRTAGAPVLVRLKRKRLRWWSMPWTEDPGPVRAEIAWPADARAGMTSRIQVMVRQELGRPTTVDLRVPLPAGASLAAPVEGIRQVQGMLSIRRLMDASTLPTVFEVPIRFALSGRFTVPEAEARLAFEEAPRAVVPSRPLVVR